MIITNTTFWNDTAKRHGGAIFSLRSSIKIKGCNFHGPFVDPGNFEGSLITSHGIMILENSSFYVYYAFMLSFLFHIMHDIKMKKSYCPQQVVFRNGLQ